MPPRLLVIMGSGETSPTMVTTHKDVLARVGPGTAVLLDTPFGFQENADEITARALTYFRDRVGRDVTPARFRSRVQESLVTETSLARLREAVWVFAGPGSPTYALRQWADTPVPGLLARTLVGGGAITFASAAALTLGKATVPVYEIYKAGEEPRWLPGLDLLGQATGLQAAVVPHFDNAEGGGHDTRYCYLGERRLAALERELPSDAFVLGVDEHTGLVIDIDAGDARVVGRGAVTVRRRDGAHVLPAGQTVTLSEIAAMARPGQPATARDAGGRGDRAGAGVTNVAGQGRSVFADAVAGHVAAFDAAVDQCRVADAVRAALALDDEISAWAADTTTSAEMGAGRAALRAMLVRLGELADRGGADPRERAAPLVEAVLAARGAARAGGRYDEADGLRASLTEAGIEVRDTPDGVEWCLPDT